MGGGESLSKQRRAFGCFPSFPLPLPALGLEEALVSSPGPYTLQSTTAFTHRAVESFYLLDISWITVDRNIYRSKASLQSTSSTIVTYVLERKRPSPCFDLPALILVHGMGREVWIDLSYL